MGSNYIAEDATITPSIQCVNDSTTGYSADFSVNGEVDGWGYFDGIHTYGAWGGFLFGTLYTDNAAIGRLSVFNPVSATTHYFIRFVMKYKPAIRDYRGVHLLPTQGKLRWRTLQSTNWDSNKEIYFDIDPDNQWHTYIINVGIKQWWQGDVNDLRIWPSIDNGEDGDEFFIRTIDIFSTESYKCRNTTCSKFSEYYYPCPWIGVRAVCESSNNSNNKLFNINNLSEFIININDYGEEIVKVKEVYNGSGREVANKLANAISRTNIGGYSEVQVEYTDNNTFKIYSGTVHETSSVIVIDNELSRYLNFFDSAGNDISTKIIGETPADGYAPLSSFKINTHQALGLLDNNESTSITFNPFQYSVEGGRRDCLKSGIGLVSVAIGANDGDGSTQPVRKYFLIPNSGKTVIDYNHPFNASGRIKKISVQCTLDSQNYVKSKNETGISGPDPGTRKGDELSGAMVMIVRPKRNGDMEVIYEWELKDRDPNRGYYDALYSLTQEGIDIDVDVFVNKGDLIAIYNANMYVGKSISGYEYDAQFYQINYKPEIGDIFNPERLYGDGSSGLLVYARGDVSQQRLYLDIDLGNRYNIENINVKGNALNNILEYNIARCLDINWQVDLFDLQHWTQHTKFATPGTFHYQRPNTYYGLDNLSDGIYNVPDGLSCDGYSITYDNSSTDWNYNAGPGIVPYNPHYFWINGDEEWLAVWLHAQSFQLDQAVTDFDYDPVAIYLHFPFEKEKQIYKCKMYFKEKFNFRSFGLSTYGGYFYTSGDADTNKYDLIPEYTKITLDNVDFFKGSPTYSMVDSYLFNNPCTGHMLASSTSKIIYEWDPILSDVVGDYTSDSGWFTYQTFAVDNADAWATARKIDWQIIEHEWEPITAKGFRIYCDFHKSTKLTELELYGIAEDLGSNLSGGIVITFSDYREKWWPTESVQNTDSSVEVFIGDSPRYFTLELIPITETIYDDISIDVNTEDLYAGTKGCEYIHYSENAKTDIVNDSQIVEVKNVYGSDYDLSIDIAPGRITDTGLLFYSTLSDYDSITNPVTGPDARYYKLYDYALRNQDYNCAINCNVYGLKNLIIGKNAYYSMNNGLVWNYYGTLSDNTSVDFFNTFGLSRSIFQLPIISRNRYWKFSFNNSTINIREIEIYYDEEKLDPLLYVDGGLPEFSGPISEHAPHLSNLSIVGSYYTIDDTYSVGIDLGEQGSIDKVVMYHDNIDCDLYVTDEYIHLYLTGDDLLDHSYYEQEMTVVGDVHNDTTISGMKLNKASLYFDGNSYLTCPHTTGFDLNNYYKSCDFFVKFEELPAAGQEVVFLQNWGTDGNHYKFNFIDNRLKVWVNNTAKINISWTPLIDTWYHIAHCWGASNFPPSEYGIWINGVSKYQASSGLINFGGAVNDINIGINLKGWISHLRWSNGPERCGSKARRVYNNASFQVPTETYLHKYEFKIYSSPDNILFGLYSTVDIFHDNRDVYFGQDNVYDGVYNNYFAIDLANRHDLGIVRNYGGSDATIIDLTDDAVVYSKDDITNINDVDFNSDYTDARWIRIALLASDNTSRVLRKIGIYPDAVVNISPSDGYNCEWEYLGPAITGYSVGTNVALDTTVSGSSSIGEYVVSHVVNGIIRGERSQSWLSDNSSEQWILIDLGENKSIYRVKIYHGYSTEDSDFIIKDYIIESSIDNISFNTRWNISNNSSFERTHDIADPFTARYIRIYITDYKANNTLFIKNTDGISYYSWKGACLREIEVYEYYGYEYISSDEWPVVAIDMRDQFYIASHSLVGIDSESTTTDWDNSSSNFAWSDSVLESPEKISFSSWGDIPNYEQWLLIKGPYAINSDYYLKHVLLRSDYPRNPINYPWWWSSIISEISRDFSHTVEISTSSLKIAYPASTAVDTVQFIEGSNWGVDSDMAFRDGLGFRWYIEDINRLDTSEGYVFFGGLDGTDMSRPIEYRWYLSTLSGTTVLQTGWNRPFFRFKDADEIIYNEDFDPYDIIQPTMLEYIQLQTFGFKFKGTGAAFNMNIDGALIQRNHFQDSSKFDFGLYLSASDYLECPLAELDLQHGTIEFWMRPDYTFVGMDTHNRFKNRSIFHFGNVANDVFGFMINSEGFNLYFGNTATDLRALVVKGIIAGTVDGLFHIAVAFSANGKNLGGDSSSIKLYINNKLVATNYETWYFSDNKLFKFTMGGKAPLSLIEHSSSLETTSIDSVISNLRIYNYCKSDFTDSMNNTFSSDTNDLLLPSKMIEISRDNVTFYKIGDPELPFYYNKVPSGNTVQVYVKSVIPGNLTGKEDRTAGIVTSWEIGV